MKAMILAAGKGTRVRPITHTTPKPMIPILQKPVMEFLLELLREHGFNEIMVNVSHLSEEIENYFRDGQRFDVQIAYSFEGRISDGELIGEAMGSAGGLKKIQDFQAFFDDTFVVLCGDALIDLDITAALAEHKAKGAVASVVALEVPLHEVQNYGVVVADADGHIQAFQEKPKPEDAKSTLASTGIYIFEPAVLDKVPAGKVYDIGSELFPRLAADGSAFFVQNRPFNWIDIGRVSDYWTVLQRVLKGEVENMPIPGTQVKPGVWVGLNTSIPWGQVKIEGPVYIGSSVKIEAGATIIGPAWIGHGSVIRSGANITRSVLFEYTRIAPDMHFFEMIVSRLYCVNRHGETLYAGDDTSMLRWGDARA
jgi:mannose-1-phosphate guanylyltransferase